MAAPKNPNTKPGGGLGSHLKADGDRKSVPYEIVKSAERMEAGQDLLAPARMTQASAALQLRIDGASWEDIARLLEFSSSIDARQSVERALAAEVKDPEKVDEIRLVNSKRLEKIYQSLARRASNPKDPDHLQYVRAAVTVIDRHSKLWGADSPQQMNVTVSPSVGEIEKWVANMAQQVHGEMIEGDILDVEVVEYDDGERDE